MPIRVMFEDSKDPNSRVKTSWIYEIDRAVHYMNFGMHDCLAARETRGRVNSCPVRSYLPLWNVAR